MENYKIIKTDLENYLSENSHDLRYKEIELNKKFTSINSNFVFLGSYLKDIKDEALYTKKTNSAKGEPYSHFKDYVKAEIGLSQRFVERLIAVVERFAENYKTLKKQYQGYSMSKLTEMLSMTDEQIQLLNPDMTITHIRGIKNFGSTSEAATSPLNTFITEEDIEELEALPMSFNKDNEYNFEYFKQMPKNQLINTVWELYQAYHKKGGVK